MHKFMVLGDVHIGQGLALGKPGTFGQLNSRIEDQKSLLAFTLQKAIEKNITSLFLTGDIFEDAKPHPQLIKIFLKWVKECEEAGIDLHIVVGNHDMIRSGAFTQSALEIIPALKLNNIHVYKDPAQIEYDTVVFTLLPFRDRRMYDQDTPQLALKELKKEIPKPHKTKTNIIVGHLTLDGSIPVGHEIDSNLNEIFCPMEIFKGYDYVTMGHIHNFQILENEPFIFHLGSMDRSNFSKTEMEGKKYLAVFDFKKKKNLDFISLPVRPLQKFPIVLPEKEENTTQFVTQYLDGQIEEGAILNIEIQLSETQEEVNKDKIVEFAKSQGAFHVPRFTQSRSVTVVQEDAVVLEKQVTPKQAVEKFLEVFAADLNLNKEDQEKVLEIAQSCIKEFKG